MERYDQLYRLYEEFDTETLRAYQHFVDIFPPVDSRVALEYWQDASEELADRKAAVRETFPDDWETFADTAAHATREQSFVALDLLTTYGRGVNALVLDVDETLRSTGNTDNEIPRETLYLLREFHDGGTPIVICTGQTLENVKGFLIQGLGNELVHSGSLSIVYEAGTGVFTPEHGGETKRLLYDALDAEIRGIFDRLRSNVLSDASSRLREGCHLQGNEFNVTLKPNFTTGSERARGIIDDALVYMLDLLGAAVVAEFDVDATAESASAWARTHYAERDPEIRDVLDTHDEPAASETRTPPSAVADAFERIDVAYYEADAAEIGSLELNKRRGVESAFEVLDIDDPFPLVMGDSKSDLRIMKWIGEAESGVVAAPAHASTDVLEYVRETDGLVFPRGNAADVLRTVYALDRLAKLDSGR
jgi:hydroxymethylpyrimidine pyrophosphatase-like HAD family hydrolase